MSPYQAAVALADSCIPVFPCGLDKAPLSAAGFHDATLDPRPEAYARTGLIGMPTGAASGIDVLDIDPRHGGTAWLAEHASRLPVTRTQRTQSGGLHIYFQARPDLRCSVSKIAPGVDVRAEGGYVIRWDTAGLQIENPNTLAPWPDWLADLAAGSRVRHTVDTRDKAELSAPSTAAAVALLDRLPNPESITRDDYVRIMLAAKGCADNSNNPEAIADAAVAWAARWPGSPGETAEREKWDSDFALRDAPLAGWQNLLAAATRLGVDTSAERAIDAAAQFAAVPLQIEAPALVRPRRMRDRILRPADCASGPRRGYIVKGLIAPGDVGALIGAPGASKSTLAPFLAYAVAQGRPVFGMRTKPGGVLYVAAEDLSGMRQRVHALKVCHGDAPTLALVDCGNLIEPAAVADLLDTVVYLRPILVIIDTIAAAWAGIDENDSAGMGGVVATARRVAHMGAAVLLLHHVAKHGDGTPRGHSVLNGTLDMCLSLTPMDENRIVRGKLAKNRNGPCDRDIAFRSTGHPLGLDEDGDEITAPLASELPRDATPQRPKLSPQENRVLDILLECDKGRGVAEQDWHAACEDNRISAADTAKNRRKVVEKNMQKLLSTGAVVKVGGLFRPGSWNRLEPSGTAGNRLEPRGTEFNAVPWNQEPTEPHP